MLTLAKFLVALAFCVVGLPVSAVITFLLIPFWRWFEAKTGIESLGHSGPAEWCSVTVYGLLLMAGFGAWFCRREKGPGQSPASELPRGPDR